MRVCVKLYPFAAAAFFVAVAEFWVGAPAAEAACGDYVHLRGNPEGVDMTVTDHAAGSPADMNATGTTHDAPAPPCQGPHCRGQSPAPDLPVPVTYSSGPDEKALITELASAALDRAVLVPASTDAPRSDCSGGRLERPPRKSS